MSETPARAYVPPHWLHQLIALVVLVVDVALLATGAEDVKVGAEVAGLAVALLAV